MHTDVQRVAHDVKTAETEPPERVIEVSKTAIRSIVFGEVERAGDGIESNGDYGSDVNPLDVSECSAAGRRSCVVGPPIQPEASGLCTGSLDINGGAEESKSHLQRSAGRWRSKPLTLDSNALRSVRRKRSRME